MIAKEFVESAKLGVICMPDPDRELSGAYVGDLLSWVMGRAKADCVWITIMSNANVIAVATLADVGCILLSENVTLDKEVATLAEEKGVNVFTTPHPSFEAAVTVSGIIR